MRSGLNFGVLMVVMAVKGLELPAQNKEGKNTNKGHRTLLSSDAGP